MDKIALKIILLFSALFMIGVAGFSGMPEASTISNQIYLDLVARAKDRPEGYNFQVVRGAYEQTEFFKPATTRPGEDLTFILGNIEKKEPGAEAYLEDYITKNFPLPEVHTHLMMWYEEHGQKEKALHHAWLARGFLNVLLRYSTGANTETAYRVINRGEIEIVLNMRGLRQYSTRRYVLNLNAYDLIHARDPETNLNKDVWFNVTALDTKPVDPR